MKNWSRGWFVVLLLALTGLCAMAQDLRLQVAPPPIAFENWKPVPREDGMAEFAASFPSAYQTGIAANDRVPLRIFLPEKRPCPVVVILHYWGAQDLRVEQNLAEELVSRGVGAVIITLPYHLSRTPPGTRSGDLAIEPDPNKLIAMTEQSVLDVRRTIDFLVSRPEVDASRIGVSGVSLGALVGITTFAVDERISRASFLLGGVDLAHILWKSSRLVPQREVFRRNGYTEGSLRKLLAPIEPLTYLPRKTGVAFVVGGKFDTVVPGDSTRRLIELMPNARVLWLDTGHYGGVFVQRRLMREVARYFDAEFSGADYVPPKKLVAPTVRLGAVLDGTNGFDIGVGLDIWQFDSRGQGFATLLGTPRGPQIILGRRLGQGYSISLNIAKGGTGLGLFWSIVL
ncbi:MAG: alpha/beta hydrolase family protein [Fimbriimonas sp.]